MIRRAQTIDGQVHYFKDRVDDLSNCIHPEVDGRFDSEFLMCRKCGAVTTAERWKRGMFPVSAN